MNEHILTVPADDTGRYTITCPGLSEHCESWIECINDGCDVETLEQAYDDEGGDPTLHGVRHRLMDGWCVRTGECWMAGHPDVREAARDLGLPPGVYPVESVHENGDDWGTLRLAVVEPKAVSA